MRECPKWELRKSESELTHMNVHTLFYIEFELPNWELQKNMP